MLTHLFTQVSARPSVPELPIPLFRLLSFLGSFKRKRVKQITDGKREEGGGGGGMCGPSER